MTSFPRPVAMTQDLDVGFVGLGAMGSPMAGRLAAAGVRLTVRDLDPDAVAGLVSAGAHVRAGDRADVARADVVVLMLPDSRIVRAEVSGPDGLLASMRPGSLLVDMSSSDPEATQKLAVEADARGVGMLDAPVSGGVRGAQTGRLAVMVGGDASALERVRPLLELMGDRISHVGASGAGHAVKALNNLLSAIGLVGAAEVLLTAARFGVDPEVALGALNDSTGRNNSTERKFAQFILNRRFDAGFTAALMVKDLRTAVGLAEATGVDAPLGRAVLDVCARALENLPPGADHTAVVRHLEDAAGVPLTDKEHRS